MKSGCASRRRGFTLIELLVVISVATVIIGLCATTIHVLLRSERDQSRAVWTAVTVSRLTEIFREDVHGMPQSRIVEVPDDSRRLALADETGREIVYTAREHVLQRVESSGGVETHRDAFHFPLESELRFERDDSPHMVRVVIELAPATPERSPEGRRRHAPPRTLIIEALADRDHRFALRKP